MSFKTFISTLLTFSLFSLTLAAETLNSHHHNQNDAWKYGTGGGVVGFIILILDIIVWMEVLQSTRPPLNKVLWCAGVFMFPIGGMVIYWLFSNREAHMRSGQYEIIA